MSRRCSVPAGKLQLHRWFKFSAGQPCTLTTSCTLTTIFYDGSAVNWAHELPEKQRNENGDRRPMQRDERKRAAQTPPPGGWPAGSTSPSSPQGLEARSRKRARTDSASSPSAESNGTTLGAVVDAQRDIRRVTADSYQGHAPSTYMTWLQGIDPQTADKPAYTSYIGAKVAQHFETGWGVGVVLAVHVDVTSCNPVCQ